MRDAGDEVDARSIWTGWDPRSKRPDADGAIPTTTATRTSYELLAVAGRGFRPPTFLTVEDPAADEGERPAGLRDVWSLEYRTIVETAPPTVTPHAIYLLGVNPPDGLDDRELDAFNAFYSDVHLREVAARRHALRAVRFELIGVRKPPYPLAPRFLATYEVDEEGAANRRHVGPPYSKGPDVWQRHTTPWRLWYRRLDG